MEKKETPLHDAAKLIQQSTALSSLQRFVVEQASVQQQIEKSFENPLQRTMEQMMELTASFSMYKTFPEPTELQKMQERFALSVNSLASVTTAAKSMSLNFADIDMNLNNACLQMHNSFSYMGGLQKLLFRSSENVLSGLNNSLSSTIFPSALSQVRNYLPHAFDFEDIYSGGYKRAYSTIPENAHVEIEKRENGEIGSDIIVCTAENDCYPLALQKDVYGCRVIFSDIEERDVVRLISFLANHFALAVTDPVAEEIRDELIKYARNYTIKIPCGKRLYRARKWDEGQSVEFLYNEILDPPYGCSGANRFSYPGQNFLYMAEDPETANKELKTDKITTTLKCILNKDLVVLDMADNYNIIFEYCQKRANETAVIPREYFLSMYIAEICMSIGIDGIRYKSSVTDGIDYVFFKIHSDSFEDEPETLIDEYLKYREISSE
jgi:hypothetical protein